MGFISRRYHPGYEVLFRILDNDMQYIGSISMSETALGQLLILRETDRLIQFDYAPAKATITVENGVIEVAVQAEKRIVKISGDYDAFAKIIGTHFDTEVNVEVI